VIALETQIETELIAPEALLRAAAGVLHRYGLQDAQVKLVSASDATLFRVDVPGDNTHFHPYLGRVAGQRFMLRMRSTEGGGLSVSEGEVAWLASLLWETELPVPEPVPTCDGALFPAFSLEEIGEMHCILFRWT
jgi:hypothetical protein